MATDPIPIESIAAHTESLFIGGGLIAAAFGFFRWMLTLAGGRQDKRIAQLERERSADRKLLMAITQALYEVMNVVERHEPDAPALEHARSMLKKAFPADPPEQPAP